MPKLKKLRLSKNLPGVNLYRKEKFAFVFRNIGLTGKRVKNDAAFSPTRQKARAFANAAKTAGILYRILQPEVTGWNEKNGYRRILACLVKATGDPATTLNGFPCNRASFPQPRLCEACSVSYSVPGKTITAVLPSLHPIKDINAPLGATHFTLSLIIKILDARTGDKQSFRNEQEVFYRLNRMKTKSIKLNAPTNDAGSLIVVIAGITFYFSSGDELYSFDNRKRDVLDRIFLQIPQATQNEKAPPP